VESDQCDVRAVVEAAKAAGYEAVYGWAWNGDGGALNMLSPRWTDTHATFETYTATDYFWSILDLL
jgi:hypothetical protein